MNAVTASSPEEWVGWASPRQQGQEFVSAPRVSTGQGRPQELMMPPPQLERTGLHPLDYRIRRSNRRRSFRHSRAAHRPARGRYSVEGKLPTPGRGSLGQARGHEPMMPPKPQLERTRLHPLDYRRRRSNRRRSFRHSRAARRPARGRYSVEGELPTPGRGSLGRQRAQEPVVPLKPQLERTELHPLDYRRRRSSHR
jgi:hypothetical protein